MTLATSALATPPPGAVPARPPTVRIAFDEAWSWEPGSYELTLRGFVDEAGQPVTVRCTAVVRQAFPSGHYTIAYDAGGAAAASLQLPCDQGRVNWTFVPVSIGGIDVRGLRLAEGRVDVEVLDASGVLVHAAEAAVQPGPCNFVFLGSPPALVDSAYCRWPPAPGVAVLGSREEHILVFDEGWDWPAGEYDVTVVEEGFRPGVPGAQTTHVTIPERGFHAGRYRIRLVPQHRHDPVADDDNWDWSLLPRGPGGVFTSHLAAPLRVRVTDAAGTLVRDALAVPADPDCGVLFVGEPPPQVKRRYCARRLRVLEPPKHTTDFL